MEWGEGGIEGWKEGYKRDDGRGMRGQRVHTEGGL